MNKSTLGANRGRRSQQLCIRAFIYNKLMVKQLLSVQSSGRGLSPPQVLTGRLAQATRPVLACLSQTAKPRFVTGSLELLWKPVAITVETLMSTSYFRKKTFLNLSCHRNKIWVKTQFYCIVFYSTKASTADPCWCSSPSRKLTVTESSANLIMCLLIGLLQQLFVWKMRRRGERRQPDTTSFIDLSAIKRLRIYEWKSSDS